MKSNSTKNSHKAKQAKSAGHGGGPEGPSGNFWTMRIEPKGVALLSETVGRCYFVIKNWASHPVRLVAQYGDLMDLRPGAVRATYACGIIRVENRDEESSAEIEFQFLPIQVSK